MKFAVFGNRSIKDFATIYEALDSVLTNETALTYLHGGADGPAKLVADFAKETGWIDVVIFKPWHMVWSKITFDRTLFFMRNKQIIDNADKIFIFTNGDKDSEVTRVKDYCDKNKINYDFIEVVTNAD